MTQSDAVSDADASVAELRATTRSASLTKVTTRDRKGTLIRFEAAAVASNWPLPELPVRGFRWAEHQTHFPGYYWSTTMKSHVGFESWHERNRLVLADFDPSVIQIHSQPFRLHFTLDGRKRHNVADFLFIRANQRWSICNVKTADALEDPATEMFFDGLAFALEPYGVDHELWTDPPSEVHLRNVRRLSQFRNPRLFLSVNYDTALERAMACSTVREAEHAVANRPHLGRALVKHMLWQHDLVTDLSKPLTATSPLQGGAI